MRDLEKKTQLSDRLHLPQPSAEIFSLQPAPTYGQLQHVSSPVSPTQPFTADIWFQLGESNARRERVYTPPLVWNVITSTLYTTCAIPQPTVQLSTLTTLTQLNCSHPQKAWHVCVDCRTTRGVRGQVCVPVSRPPRLHTPPMPAYTHSHHPCLLTYTHTTHAC
jgi:hypothetical protein